MQADIYISFSHAQHKVVADLIKRLEATGLSTYTILDVLPGEDWEATISDAIKTSGIVVVVISKEYLLGKASLAELEAAIARETEERRTVVVPVMLDAWDADLRSMLPESVARKASASLHGLSGAAFDSAIDRLAEALHTLLRRNSLSSPGPTPAPSGPAQKPAAAPGGPAPEPLKVPPDLALACATGECVLFAGAGLSARAGVPTWNQLLLNLLQYAVSNKTLDASYADTLRVALQESGRNEAADSIVQTFEGRRGLLQTFLNQQHPENVPLATAHRWLQQIPFESVITTNYDRLLEDALPDYAHDGLYTTHEADRLLDALTQKRRFILKLYGIIERVETLIFAPYEYREAIASNIPFSRFMEGAFFSRSFLFLGLSLEGIQDFLSGFVFRGVSPRKHFALVAVSGSAWKVKAELLQRRYNVEVIAFPVSETYPEVDAFLEQLSHVVRPVGHTSRPAPASLPGLRRVVLEDIGPYERLELHFAKEHNWKVLLGDNGVGKSTILKAIAVAIVGSDARSLAGRLVRTGKTKGRIVLYTEQNPTSGYVTEILTKDMVSEAEIVSLPTRPMEAEGWLALGFSALRVVTWSSSTGPQPIIEKGRPTSEDLLPLLSGEADPRMDRLKQWIVNLDSADKGKPRTLTGHQDRVSSVIFSQDGRTLISGAIDRTIRFWDLSRNTQSKSINAHASGVNSLSLSGDGQILASGSFDRLAKTWKAATGEPLSTFRGSKSQILSVTLDQSGERLVTASESGSLRTWTARGYETDKFGSGLVWCVVLSPDDRTIGAGMYDGTVVLWNNETRQMMAKLTVGHGVIMGIAWFPDGDTFVCASKNGPVTIWNVREARLIRELEGADTMAVAVSPDGAAVAAGFANGEITVWDAKSGDQVMKIQAHAQAVWSLAFSPDGKTLASGSEDRTIKLWTLADAVGGVNQQEAIRRFFRLIGSLTERQDIDFLHVTPDYRVMVKAADTPHGVPIESLSQGMTSLFGWIGVVCQRLKETLQVATQDPLPTNSYALVLIDELDAHMHPRWQQVLVDRLKQVFPNVQFLASTHSPLIVGGLARGEVERFAMRKGKVERVDFDPDMTLGRTDQILTGELFGLPSTLDSATQELMKEYERLLGLSSRDDEQERRFNELSRQIEERIPPAAEEPLERRARELLEALQRASTGTELDARVQERMSQLGKALSRDAT